MELLLATFPEAPQPVGAIEHRAAGRDACGGVETAEEDHLPQHHEPTTLTSEEEHDERREHD